MEDRLIFVAGFAAGVLVTIIFMWLASRIQAARKMAGLSRKQGFQSKNMSASQVHRASIRASFAWLFWLLVLVGFLAALGYGAYLLFSY